jgi:hypothetical protein
VGGKAPDEVAGSCPGISRGGALRKIEFLDVVLVNLDLVDTVEFLVSWFEV